MIITVAHFNTGKVDYLKIDADLEETIDNVENFLISLGYDVNEIVYTTSNEVIIHKYKIDSKTLTRIAKGTDYFE